MKKTLSKYSALILAGGLSQRMEYPKPWLMYDEDTTFAEKIVRLYASIGIREIVLVLNDNYYRAPWLNSIRSVERSAVIVGNPNPEKGRLHSIFLGLKEIMAERVIIHNVDNPFIEPELLKTMIFQAGDEEVCIPAYQGKGGHPIMINANVKQEILYAHEEYTSLKELLQGFKKTFVEVSSPAILTNINTPDEYHQFHGHL